MRDDVERVSWIARSLQDYHVESARAEQLAGELETNREFLRAQADGLTFEDEPSSFRVVQARGALHDE